MNPFCPHLALAALAAIAVVGCKPDAPVPFEPYATTATSEDLTRPNCAAGFRAFVDYAQARPGPLSGYTVRQPLDPVDPLEAVRWADVRVYAVDGENRIYVFTRPGHPAHPAVVIKTLGLTTEGPLWSINGCGWGDPTAYSRMEAAAKVLTRQYDREIRYPALEATAEPPR